MYIDPIINQKLIELITHVHVSQKNLARVLKISEGETSKIVAGLKELKMQHIQMLVKEFNLPACYFFGDNTKCGSSDSVKQIYTLDRVIIKINYESPFTRMAVLTCYYLKDIQEYRIDDFFLCDQLRRSVFTYIVEGELIYHHDERGTKLLPGDFYFLEKLGSNCIKLTVKSSTIVKIILIGEYQPLLDKIRKKIDDAMNAAR